MAVCLMRSGMQAKRSERNWWPRTAWFVQVNKCDLAKAKMDLKTMAQENERLVAKTRAQAAHVLALEVSGACLASRRPSYW